MEFSVLTVCVILIFYFRKHLYPFSRKPPPERQRPNDSKKILIPKLEIEKNHDKAVFYLRSNPLLCVSLITLVVIEILNISFSFFFGVESSSVSELANTIAISASAVSILFPVALLIIDSEWGNSLNSILKSQTLLSYSYAMPWGVSLLATMMRYSFKIHPIVGSLMAVYAVGIAGWIFFKLVRIVLFPTIRKSAEEIVIKDLVLRSIVKIAEVRAGSNITAAYFENQKDSLLTFKPYCFGDDQFVPLLKITAKRGGIISLIDVGALEPICHALMGLVSSKQATQNSGSASSETENTQIKMKFYLKNHVGQEVKNDSPLIEVLILDALKKSLLTEQQLDHKKYENLFRECFVIENNYEHNLPVEQFKEFIEDLKRSSLKAAKEGDIEHISLLERFLGAWLAALADAFEELKLKYDLKSVRNESSFFLYDTNAEWTPLNGAIKIIEESGIRSLKFDTSNSPEFAKNIIEMSATFLWKSANRNEVLSCEQLLWARYRICFFALSIKHDGAEFLLSEIAGDFKSIFKYHITHKLDDVKGSIEKLQTTLDFAKSIFGHIQEYLRLSFTFQKERSYITFIEMVRKYPELFQHEDIDHRLEMYKLAKKNGWATESEKEHQELIRKQEILKEIRQWRADTIIGQGTLFLMAIDGEARNINPSRNVQDVEPYIQIIKRYLPTTLHDAFINFLTFSEGNRGREWGWSQWEHISTVDEGAKWMKYDHILLNFLCMSLLYAASLDATPKDISDELVDRGLRFKLDKDNGILKSINENLDLAIRLKLIDGTKSDEAKNRLEFYVQKYLSRAEVLWKIKLSTLPLDAEVINTMHQQFDDAFNDNVRLRKLFPFSSIENPPKESLSKDQWGSNSLFEREYFVEEPGVHKVQNIGADYGSGFARSEDEFCCHEILTKCKPQYQMSIEDAIKAYIVAGFSKNDLALLVSRELFTIKSLRNDPRYEPIYRNQNDEIKVLIPKPDGVFAYDGILVPIFELVIRSEKPKNFVIAVARSSVTMTQTRSLPSNSAKILIKCGFTFNLEDPLTDIDFRKELVASKREWLEKFPPEQREQMAALRVGISFLQRIQVDTKKLQAVTGILSSSDIEG